MKLRLGNRTRTIEDFEDFKFYLRDWQIKYVGTVERQVAVGFALLLMFSVAAVAFIHLNRTPTRIEARNDQEATF